jgi:hypothetical protein
MSAQQNKALVHRLFEEVWNKNNMEVAKEIIHDDYKSSEDELRRGIVNLGGTIESYRETYSDLNFKIERMFTEEDTVVTIWRATGVANFKFFTNRKGEEQNMSLKAEGVSLSRIADGKIIENNLYWPNDPLFP